MVSAKRSSLSRESALERKIRPMQVSDADAVQRLAHLYLGPWYGSQVKAVKDWVLGSNYKTAWVIEVNSRIVAYIILSDKPNREYIKISALVVDEPFRKRGYGQALMSFALNYAKSTPKQFISLSMPESNGLGRNFVRRNSFNLAGRIEGRSRSKATELIYTRRLH